MRTTLTRLDSFPSSSVPLALAQATPLPHPRSGQSPRPLQGSCCCSRAAPGASPWVRFSLQSLGVTKRPPNPPERVFSAVHRCAVSNPWCRVGFLLTAHHQLLPSLPCGSAVDPLAFRCGAQGQLLPGLSQRGSSCRPAPLCPDNSRLLGGFRSLTSYKMFVNQLLVGMGGEEGARSELPSFAWEQGAAIIPPGWCPRSLTLPREGTDMPEHGPRRSWEPCT